jgi:hypothetical protein
MFGSPEVTQAAEEFVSKVNGFFVYAQMYRMIRDQAPGHDWRVLEGSSAVRRVLPIQAATDGRTGVVEALAAQDPTSMVHAAEDLENPLAAAAAPGATVRLTGPAEMWADFNTNNKQAMMRSEVLPVPRLCATDSSAGLFTLSIHCTSSSVLGYGTDFGTAGLRHLRCGRRTAQVVSFAPAATAAASPPRTASQWSLGGGPAERPKGRPCAPD